MMPGDRNRKAARKAATRSRVTNGKALFLRGVDGRSALVRRYRDVLAEIVSDLGGADVLSEAQRQLARRAATISVECERFEAIAVKDGSLPPASLDTYGQLTDRLGRCFQRLGLERVAREIPSSSNRFVEFKIKGDDARL